MTHTETVGVVIRDARLALGYSQAQLAERAGIGFNSLSRYERGLSNIHLDALCLIADALDVQPHDLLAEAERRMDATSGKKGI